MVLQEKAGPVAPPAPRGSLLRGIIQVIGELLITAGIILLLFVAWQLWWTNVESDAKQSQVIRNSPRTSAPPRPPRQQRQQRHQPRRRPAVTPSENPS